MHKVLVLFFISSASLAGPFDRPFKFKSEKEKKVFCEEREGSKLRKKLFTIEDPPPHMLSFASSSKGFMDLGICWWHSRFHRNSLYLNLYDPDTPLPENPEEREYLIKGIIEKIKNGKEVVRIPGYKNLWEFSKDNEELIIDALEDWQDDGVVSSLIKGSSGSSTSKEDLWKELDQIYDAVNSENRIVYTKMQMPGISSHSSLIYKMKKLKGGGFSVYTLDGNFNKSTTKYKILPGDETVQYGKGRGSSKGRNFVFYAEEIEQEDELRLAIRNTCDSYTNESDFVGECQEALSPEVSTLNELAVDLEKAIGRNPNTHSGENRNRRGTICSGNRDGVLDGELGVNPISGGRGASIF